MTTLDAVLFDLDGTLIDSEPYWMAAEHRLAADYGIPWGREETLALVGVDLWDGARFFIERGVTMEQDAIVERLVDEVTTGLRAELPLRPGALELLADVRASGARTALVTMSTRSIVDLVVADFDATLGLRAFDATVSGDDVERGKPNPDAYLRGLELLGADASRSVGIEDSVPGATASIAAGLATIGVPHAADISHVTGIVPWPTLEGRTASDVEAILGER